MLTTAALVAVITINVLLRLSFYITKRKYPFATGFWDDSNLVIYKISHITLIEAVVLFSLSDAIRTF